MDLGHNLEEGLAGHVKEGLGEVDAGRPGIQVEASIFSTNEA